MKRLSRYAKIDMKKSLSKEERIEVAVLLLNETYSFGEVLKELDAGKTVEELEK